MPRNLPELGSVKTPGQGLLGGGCCWGRTCSATLGHFRFPCRWVCGTDAFSHAQLCPGRRLCQPVGVATRLRWSGRPCPGGRRAETWVPGWARAHLSPPQVPDPVVGALQGSCPLTAAGESHEASMGQLLGCVLRAELWALGGRLGTLRGDPVPFLLQPGERGAGPSPRPHLPSSPGPRHFPDVGLPMGPSDLEEEREEARGAPRGHGVPLPGPSRDAFPRLLDRGRNNSSEGGPCVQGAGGAGARGTGSCRQAGTGL